MELKVGYRQGLEEDALGQSCLRQRGEGSDGGKDGRLSQLSDLYLEDEEDVPQAERVADTGTEEETEEEKTRRMHYMYAAITRNRASLFLRRHGILPPKGRLSQLLTRVLVVFLWFGVTWAILGEYVHHAPIDLDTSPSRGSCDVGSSVTRVNTSNITNDTSFNLTAQNSTTKSSTCQMEKIDSLASLFWEYAMVSGPDSTEELSSALDDGGEDNCSGTSVSGQCVLREAVQVLCPEAENSSARLGFFDIEKGHFFGLIILGIVAAVAGYLVSLIRLPPLLGMLIAGVVLNNIPYIAVTRLINPNWSSVVRSIALTVILTRGGIAMDAAALKKNLLPVLALGALPCLVEGGIIAIITAFYLELKWQWAVMIGYMLAAISPAVLVPNLLNIQTKKPPNADDRGLPTMLIVSAAFDDVICIALFGMFLGLAFSQGTHLALSIARGPIEVVLGLVYGVVVGVALWYLPSTDTKRASKNRNRFLLLFGFALFGLFGAQQIKIGGTGLVGAGALSVLVVAFVAHLRWKKDPSTSLLRRALLMMWLFVQPFLFGLIGAAVDVYSIDPQNIGKALVLIVCGLTARLTVVALVALARRSSWRHIVFACMSWIPKATVQAALGGIAVDIAAQSGSPEDRCNGSTILTLVVLTIIIAAPVGATLMSVFGPALLYSLPLCSNQQQEQTDPEGVNGEEQAANGNSQEADTRNGPAMIPSIENSL